MRSGNRKTGRRNHAQRVWVFAEIKDQRVPSADSQPAPPLTHRRPQGKPVFNLEGMPARCIRAVTAGETTPRGSQRSPSLRRNVPAMCPTLALSISPPMLRRTTMARCNCNPCCYARAACSCDCTCATQPEPATIRDMPYQWNVEPAPTERAGVPDDTHAFKNFHRSLCARFGYTHDEIDWRRDQVSLEEHIAMLTSAPQPVERAGVPDWYSYVPITERHTIEITTGQLISDPDGRWVLRDDVDAALLAALRPDGDKT